MPLDALALALGAAGLHAAWNLLLARERDTEAALAVALLALVATIALPAALTWRVESTAVPYIAGSAALELVYVALLAAAYRRYELSLVYPVARGLAPALALLLVAAVGGARPSPLGVAGVLVVSSDAHQIRALDYVEFGVAQARRAWLTKEQVANTRTWAQLQKLMKR